jgi:hypothetical protein
MNSPARTRSAEARAHRAANSHAMAPRYRSIPAQLPATNVSAAEPAFTRSPHASHASPMPWRARSSARQRSMDFGSAGRCSTRSKHSMPGVYSRLPSGRTLAQRSEEVRSAVTAGRQLTQRFLPRTGACRSSQRYAMPTRNACTAESRATPGCRLSVRARSRARVSNAFQAIRPATFSS